MNNQVDVHKAINAQLEILHLRRQIEALEDIVKANVTIEQQESPNLVTVDLNELEAGISTADHVGHQLRYKGVEISLHTGHNKTPEQKVFACVMD